MPTAQIKLNNKTPSYMSRGGGYGHGAHAVHSGNGYGNGFFGEFGNGQGTGQLRNWGCGYGLRDGDGRSTRD